MHFLRLDSLRKMQYEYFSSVNWNSFVRMKADFWVAVIAVGILLVMVIPVFQKSWDTIQIVRHTVYPGNRLELGGFISSVVALITQVMNYALGLWLPTKDVEVLTNNCEAARMFDLAPLGIGLAITYFITKKNDVLLRNLLIVQAFFLAWCVFSWPIWLAKVSLMSNVTGGRIVLAIGMVNLLLLVRVLTVWPKAVTKWQAWAFSGIGSLLAVAAEYGYYPSIFNYKYIIASIILVFVLWYSALRRKFYVLTCMMIIVMIYAGGRVNPIAYGVDSIYQSATIRQIQEISRHDSGLWISSNLGGGSNIPIMAGAPTINSINVYPVIERWKRLDSTGEQSNIYNRYAHIWVQVYDGPTSMDNPQHDVLSVKLNIDDLKCLDVRYVFSHGSLQGLSGKNTRLNELFRENDLYIYRVE